MSRRPEDPDRPLGEIAQFLRFLGSLWALLAGVAALFPLSNELLAVIPLARLGEDGVWIFLPTRLVSTTATLASIFILLWTYADRGTRRSGAAVRRSAARCFALGLGALVLYLALYYTSLVTAYSSWGWESDDPRHLLVEVPLLGLFVTCFALLTRAFALLALREFQDRRRGDETHPPTGHE